MAYISESLTFESGGDVYIKGSFLLYQDPVNPSTNKPYATINSLRIYAKTQAALTNKTVSLSASLGGKSFTLSSVTWSGPLLDSSKNEYYLYGRTLDVPQVNLTLSPGDSFSTTIRANLQGTGYLRCSGSLNFPVYCKITAPASVKLNYPNHFSCTAFTVPDSALISASGYGGLRPSYSTCALYLDESTPFTTAGVRGQTVSGFYWYPPVSLAKQGDFSDNVGTYYLMITCLQTRNWYSDSSGGFGGLRLSLITLDTLTPSGRINWNETPPSSAAPTVSLTATEVSGVGLLAQYGRYIKGMSQVKYTASVTYKYGAREIFFDLTVGYEYVTAKSLTFWPEANGTAVAHAEDDHDGETETSATYRVYDYWTPGLTQAIHRCRSDGTRDDAGSYCLIEWEINIAPLGSQNSRSLTIQHPAGTTSPTLNSYTASGELIVAADPEHSYDISFVLSDDFNTITRTVRLSTAGVIMDIYHGGHGLAFGKVAETDHALEISAELDTILNTTDAKKINLVDALKALAQATGVDIYVHDN